MLLFLLTEASPHNVYGAAEASPGYSSSGQNLYVAAPVRGGDARRGPMSHEQLDQPPRPPPPRNEGNWIEGPNSKTERNTKII